MESAALDAIFSRLVPKLERFGVKNDICLDGDISNKAKLRQYGPIRELAADYGHVR
jgi:hypothetical protein